jgi:hypothetical protein
MGRKYIFFILQSLTHLFSTFIDFSLTFSILPSSINVLDGGKIDTLLM